MKRASVKRMETDDFCFVPMITQCVRKCLKHERYAEACVSLEEASTSDANEPSGRLEWVIARAFNKGYDDTAQFSVDVDRTWEKLEKKWITSGEEKKLEALEVVRGYFKRKWQSLGIGSSGGLVCIPSVGISKAELEAPTATMSERSLASTIMTTAQTSMEHLASDSDTQTRMTKGDTERKSELERCKRVIQNFIKTPEALHFKDPVDARALNITNYSKLVKQPMDFTSILSKIDAGEIADAESVWDACGLIWFNCRAVHPPNSEMIRTCKRAELMFAAAWRADGLVIIQPVPTEIKDSSAKKTMDAPPMVAVVGSKQKSDAMSTATSTVPQKTKRVAAYKCDVCKRSKKGRCGTESAPKSCLERSENQTNEKQAAIRQRLSKLKPMPERKKPDKSTKEKPIKVPAEKKPPKGTKRKMTEAELQEDGFRRIFDVNDPDNFITRMEDQQHVAQTSTQWDSASYHLMNEQIRLQQLQQRMLTNEKAQPRQAVDDAGVKAKAQVIKQELAQIYSLMNHLQMKQVKVGALLNTPRLGRENRQMLVRTRTTIQNQLANLAKRHNDRSQSLQQLLQAAPAPAKQPSKPKQTVPSMDELMDFNNNTTSNDLSVATAQLFDDSREKTDAGLITKDDIFFDFPTPP